MLRLYITLTTLAEPLLRLHLRRRAGRGKECGQRLGERRGVDATPRPQGLLVWLHAASVGETISILPVIGCLLQRADVSVLVTTGTVTSAAVLEQRRAEFGVAARLLHRFVPLDVPRWATRFVSHWRPNVAGFVESEIWPNLLLACHRQRVPMMLVNARLSAGSFAWWRRLPGLAKRMFGGFAAIQPQSEGDAERLRALGGGAVGQVGNLKFATPSLPYDAEEFARLQALLGERPRWLAASTHPGEEAMAASVHQALAAEHPGLITLVAPRHPERGAQIAEALRQLPGLVVALRSAGEDAPLGGGIWIVDTLGELGLWYRLCPIAFVGRSLAVGGGQNPLEPARLGCAVVMGPLVANFADVVTILQAQGALDMVADPAGLQDWVAAALRDPARVAAMGQAGLQAARRAGALPAEVARTLLTLAENAA